MLNYNMLSKMKIVSIYTTLLFLFTACNPLKEKQPVQSIVELEYTDPELVQQNSNEPDHAVSGNLTLEIQEDLTTGKKILFASASFYEPSIKNVLFDDIPTNLLNKNIYKPKPPAPADPPPVDQPCGIPGFPDCNMAATTNPIDFTKLISSEEKNEIYHSNHKHLS